MDTQEEIKKLKSEITSLRALLREAETERDAARCELCTEKSLVEHLSGKIAAKQEVIEALTRDNMKLRRDLSTLAKYAPKEALVEGGAR